MVTNTIHLSTKGTHFSQNCSISFRAYIEKKSNNINLVLVLTSTLVENCLQNKILDCTALPQTTVGHYSQIQFFGFSGSQNGYFLRKNRH